MLFEMGGREYLYCTHRLEAGQQGGSNYLRSHLEVYRKMRLRASYLLLLYSTLKTKWVGRWQVLVPRGGVVAVGRTGLHAAELH